MTNKEETITKIHEELSKTTKDSFQSDKDFGRNTKDYAGIDMKDTLTAWQNIVDTEAGTSDVAYDWQSIDSDNFIAIRINKNNIHKFDLLSKDDTIHEGCYPVGVHDSTYNDKEYKWEDIKENSLVTLKWSGIKGRPAYYSKIYVSRICNLFDGGLNNPNNYLLYDTPTGSTRLYKDNLNAEIVDIKVIGENK